MKETILSNCEKNFILRAAQESKRLDGRKLDGFRNLKVHFGQSWGLCYVSLGETKVLTQVTCEIQEPKTTRPNEGKILINVELSPMAASHFELNRSSELSIHINRLLEKCIKDSRAVDLESLCIVAEEKVWVLRVDVNVLNHDGNLVDCSSISVLAALAHFKRPDVTTDGENIIVHDVLERDPIPIVLHHYPVCVSFALLNNSENIFADPTVIEEKVSDAILTFGINAYKEICCLHLGGAALTRPKLILTCSTKAAVRAKQVVDVIKEVIKLDAEARNMKKSIGFVHSFEWNKLTALSEERLKVQIENFSMKEKYLTDEDTKLNDEKFEIIDLGDNCAELTCSSTQDNRLPEKNSSKKSLEGKIEDSIVSSLRNFGDGGPSKWILSSKIPNTLDSESSSDLEIIETNEVLSHSNKIESIDLSGDSEEEGVMLQSQGFNTSDNISAKKKSSDNLKRTNVKNSSQTSFLDKPNKNKKKQKKQFIKK